MRTKKTKVWPLFIRSVEWTGVAITYACMVLAGLVAGYQDGTIIKGIATAVFVTSFICVPALISIYTDCSDEIKRNNEKK